MSRIAKALIAVVLLEASVWAQTNTPEEIAGVLCGRAETGEKEGLTTLFLPLKQTDVHMDVTAGRINTTVTQTFENDTEHPLEAAYIFPLPSRATVTDMEMRTEDRVISSVVKEREEARKTYEKAKKAGKKTALLEQERPNIFTTSVANFMPGETVSVSFTYMQSLTYENGSYNINFPMVVGQRYIPWKIEQDEDSGAKIAVEVPDPDRINPPVLHPNIDPEHHLEIQVELTGIPVEKLSSTTHAIEVEKPKPDRHRITLLNGNTVPDSDFNLKVDLARNDQPRISFVESRKGGEHFGLLTVFPPTGEPSARRERMSREVVFLIDTSGSMSGASIGQAKAGLKRCMEMLNPEDRFTIVRFASEYSCFSPRLRKATAAKLGEARGYIDCLTAGGGTEMQPALEYCLDLPHKPDTMRLVVFLTDGCVGNEDSLMRLLSRKLGSARLFTFAIGSAPNEFLARRMAEIGRGQFRFIHSHEDIGSVMGDFFNTVDAPVFTDVELRWIDRSGEVRKVLQYPEPCPDIFHARPLQVAAKSSGGFAGAVEVEGSWDGERKTLKLDIADTASARHGAIDKLFAKSRIDALMYERLRAATSREKDILREQVVATALKHELVSKFTSRVAVEERVTRTDAGDLKSAQVPTPLPKGWDPTRFCGTATQDALLVCLGLLAAGCYAFLTLAASRRRQG